MPTAETVTVTVPAPVGVTVEVTAPDESVVPLAGASVTAPVPDALNVTACPGMIAPAPLLTVTVSVALEPPITSDDALDATVIVAPLIKIGICVDFPLAVAVMVAVRLAGLVVPELNVTVALPLESLVAELAESNPVSAENVTATPDMAAFDASATIAVMVDVVLLSDATDVEEALRLIVAAVGTGTTGVVGVVVEFPAPPPPHAPSNANNAIKKNDEIARDELIFNMCSCC